MVWIYEYKCLERVLLAVDFQGLANEKVQLLFLLIDKAWPEVFDPRVSHTHLSNQEIKQYDLHYENVANEEEPDEADDIVLVWIF